eukprot:gene25733-11393_t
MLRSPSNAVTLLSRLQQAYVMQSMGPTTAQQIRSIGGDKVTEFYGRPSKYTEGTGFLGTPKDHLNLTHKRPLSPDVLEIDGKTAHYKFPIGALSSIANRVTGVILSVGFTTAGVVSVTGNLPGLVSTVASTHPIILFPFKLAVSYTIFYHYLGGLRHLLWDHSKIGLQADKSSLLDLKQVTLSSQVLFGVAGVMAFIVACM